jgi:hypothetical protein
VEWWIRRVQREFLNHALNNSKCIELHYEYTDAVKNVKKRNLPPEKKQCTIVLQLFVVSGALVFQICHADAVPELLREFFNNNDIMFWGTAIQCDVHMLEYYGITILESRNLLREIPNPTCDYPLGLYDLVNGYIQTELSKNDPNVAYTIEL